MLKELGVSIQSGLCEVDGIKGDVQDFEYAKTSKMYALDPTQEAAQEAAILAAKENHDSVGGVVLTTATGVPIGLGEPLYYKLDAILAEAMMGINAAKGVAIGAGFASVSQLGTEHRDQMTPDGFLTNNAGGILGGISSGQDVLVRVAFKPTSSIRLGGQTVDVAGASTDVITKGRHDPCVGIRATPIAEAMVGFWSGFATRGAPRR